MSARRWIETLDENRERTSVSLVDSFLAANAETIEPESIHLIADDGEAEFGGGAAPLVYVRWLPQELAAKLVEIEAMLPPDGDSINVVRDEAAPLLWSIWSTEGVLGASATLDIIGAGATIEEAADEALAQVRSWRAEAVES